MKKILALITLSILFSCKKSENDTPKETQNEVQKETLNTNNFEKTFEGKISDKIEIIMKLKSKNGNITGQYYYKKVGQNINLNGVIDNNGKFEISEFDEKENKVAILKGLINSKFEIIGTWNNINSEKELKLYLSEASIDYGKGLSDKTSQNSNSLNGIYESSSDDSMSNVEIEILQNGKFKFDITVGTEEGCVGQIDGIGNLNKDDIGTFSNEECQNLTFKFNNNKLEITEENCDLHGMSCSFSGTYTK